MTPYARAVLDLVDQVPAGAVVTYGDVAELTGQGSARTVGMVLSRWGSEVAWWRVVQASGQPYAGVRALELLADEGCPIRGDRVDLGRARWGGPEVSDAGGGVAR
jgi:alkylated DNA nucleotide flippase Atl1